MKATSQPGGIGQVRGIAAVGAVSILLGMQANAGDWTGDVQAGAGYWSGNATYSIGGEFRAPGYATEQLPDKVSELKFPLDVPYGSLGGSLLWKGRLEIHGTVMANLSDPSTKVTDSDWGVLPGSSANTLDVYSESDASLSAVAVDAGVRYWLKKTASTNRLAWSIGVGPSLSYQHMDWKLSNLDEWSPSNPELDHVYEAGEVATYRSDILMPYLDVAAIVKVRQLSGRLEFGVGPALVQDEDNHLLREKKMTGDLTGVGVKGEAEIRYNFTKRLFALARVSALSIIDATGTQTQEGYGGDSAGYYAEIDEKFTLTSINGGVAVGCAF